MEICKKEFYTRKATNNERKRQRKAKRLGVKKKPKSRGKKKKEASALRKVQRWSNINRKGENSRGCKKKKRKKENENTTHDLISGDCRPGRINDFDAGCDSD